MIGLRKSAVSGHSRSPTSHVPFMRHTTRFTSFSPAPTGERRTLPALRWLGQAVPKLLLGRLHAHLGVELDLLVLGLGGRGARDIAVTTPHDDPSELREAMCRLLGLVVWVGVG